MSNLFISRSSRDNAAAKELQAKLQEQGHRPVFLDLEPETGIQAGVSWERGLNDSTATPILDLGQRFPVIVRRTDAQVLAIVDPDLLVHNSAAVPLFQIDQTDFDLFWMGFVQVSDWRSLLVVASLTP